VQAPPGACIFISGNASQGMSERHSRYRAFLQTLQSTSVFLGPCDASGPYFVPCERCGQSFKIVRFGGDPDTAG